MDKYAEFKERGYRVVAYIPTTRKETRQFLVQVYKRKKFVKEINVPMEYFPLFGVDVSDQQTLEEKTEELMRGLL